MHQWIVSALVQIMACRLYSVKPLSEPMLDYYQLDPWEQSSVKFKSKYKIFHPWNCVWKYRLHPGRDELIELIIIQVVFFPKGSLYDEKLKDGSCTHKYYFVVYFPDYEAPLEINTKRMQSCEGKQFATSTSSPGKNGRHFWDDIFR